MTNKELRKLTREDLLELLLEQADAVEKQQRETDNIKEVQQAGGRKRSSPAGAFLIKRKLGRIGRRDGKTERGAGTGKGEEQSPTGPGFFRRRDSHQSGEAGGIEYECMKEAEESIENLMDAGTGQARQSSSSAEKSPTGSSSPTEATEAGSAEKNPARESSPAAASAAASSANRRRRGKRKTSFRIRRQKTSLSRSFYGCAPQRSAGESSRES